MKCVFPASFDPITLGHLDLIRRAAALFGEVDVVVMNSNAKRYLFPAEVRLEMVERAVAEIAGARAVAFEGLTCEYLEKTGIRTVVRGLRNATDFDYEMEYFAANRSATEVEMVFLPTKQEWFHVSSSVAREVLVHGRTRDLDKYVPREILPILEREAARRQNQWK